MDLESTVETVVSYFPDSLGLSGVLIDTAYHLPAQLDFITVMEFLMFFAAGALVLSILGRFVLGRHSSLNHSVSCVMGVLSIYALTIVIYTFKPWNLENLLSPLPFVTFAENYLLLLQFGKAEFTTICHEVLSLIILVFLINLMESFIPRGKNVISWYLLRFLSVVLSMLLHFVVNWAIRTYLPDAFATYAPSILLILLLSMLVLGFMNAILGLFLVVVNPIIGALYTFFFSNIVGKQITKAFFTSAILIAIFYLLDYSGYTVISISMSCLMGYVPVLVVCLILWYLIGHLL